MQVGDPSKRQFHILHDMAKELPRHIRDELYQIHPILREQPVPVEEYHKPKTMTVGVTNRPYGLGPLVHSEDFFVIFENPTIEDFIDAFPQLAVAEETSERFLVNEENDVVQVAPVDRINTRQRIPPTRTGLYFYIPTRPTFFVQNPRSKENLRKRLALLRERLREKHLEIAEMEAEIREIEGQL